MTDELLLNCACGHVAHVMAKHYTDGTHEWWVECRVCGKSTAHKADADEALREWREKVTK